jgi:uncharacterized membrane protein YkvA (DUF1232 family)
MSDFAKRGFSISKNAIFGSFLGRATKVLGKPLKVVLILDEVATRLADAHSKDNKFKQLIDTALAVVRLVRSYVAGEYRQVHSSTIVSGIAVFLYVLSPIDLVPDFIPVVGFLDDLSLISWFVGKFKGEIASFREWEARTAQLAPSAPAHGIKELPAVAELGHS